MQKADLTSVNDRETIDSEYVKALSKKGVNELQKTSIKDDLFINNKSTNALALQDQLGIENPKITGECRASRLSHSQKRNSKAELSNERINKEILNFIDGRGSKESGTINPFKDPNEAENPFATNVCINEILKEPTNLEIIEFTDKANGQPIESKYFSFKNKLKKKETFIKEISEKEVSESIYESNFLCDNNLINHNNNNNKNYNSVNKAEKLDQLESQMANISPIPKISRMDYVNDNEKNHVKNFEDENLNRIKLINADLKLNENPNDNFNLYENEFESSKREIKDLTLKSTVANNSNLNEHNKLNLNEEYFDKNNKETLKEFLKEEEAADHNNFNNNENKKLAEFPNQMRFSDDLSSIKLHNQVFSGMGIDKISTVFFNSKNNFKTNDFETMEIIRENFESLGYTNNFESQVKDNDDQVITLSSPNGKNFKNVKNTESNTEQKLFELKEFKVEKQSKLDNSFKEEKESERQDNAGEAQEEHESNKSYDTFQYERHKFSQLTKQNKLSFASTNTMIQDSIYNRNQLPQLESESERNAINNNNFDYKLKKRKSNCEHVDREETDLPLVSNSQSQRILNKNNQANFNPKKDLNSIEMINNENKNIILRKMQTLKNQEYCNLISTEKIFRTIDEEDNFTKNNLRGQFYRNSFLEKENASFCNEILDNNPDLNINKNLSANTLNRKTVFVSSRQGNLYKDKDLVFNSEKAKNSKKRNTLETEIQKNLPLQLNNFNYPGKNAMNSQKNKSSIANKDHSPNNNPNNKFSIEGDNKRKKMQKSNSLVDFPSKNELQPVYNLSKKNQNEKVKIKKSIKKLTSNYNKTTIKYSQNLKNKTKLVSSSSKSNVLNTNVTNNNINSTNTNNPSEGSVKATQKDENRSASMYRRSVGIETNSSLRKSEEEKKQSFFAPFTNKIEDSAKDLKFKNYDDNNNNNPNNENSNNVKSNKNSKANLDIHLDNENKINRYEYNCNLNNFNNEFVLTTLNQEDFNTNNDNNNECNLSQSEDKNRGVIQIANNAYDKKPKQMTSYNKNFNNNKTANNKNNSGNVLANSANEMQNFKKDSIFNINNNLINNNENKNLYSLSTINNLNKNNNQNNNNNYIHNIQNISSHKRTYSEALENNSKKSEFGFNFNNNNKILNSTNLLSNSKDLGDPAEKINKIREISTGKYMHVFTDVENDKSNVSYQSSRKNSRINDTFNQTEGDLSSYRFNKFSPHYNQVNKFNFQGSYFNPEDILKNMNSNANANANNADSFLDNSNFVSNFSLHNNNNSYYNNNGLLSGNNFRSKNYTPNSFRNNNSNVNANNNPLNGKDNKIKNIFS